MKWPWRSIERRWLHVSALALLTLLKGALWMGMIPPLLVADEPAHFDSVQFRAEHHAAPFYDNSGRRIHKVISPHAAPELALLWKTGSPHNYYRSQHARDHLPEKLAELALTPAGRDSDGQNPALEYPGFYYWLGVPFYDRFVTSSVVTRILAVRFLSLLFGLAAVIATYFAARLVHDDDALSFAAAALVCLQPMASQQTSVVNNDAGIIGLCALAFYFQLRVLASLPGWPSATVVIGLIGSVVCIIFTKPTGYGALPGLAVVALAVAYAHRKRRAVQVAAALGALLFAVGVFVFRERLAQSLPGDTSQPGPYGAPNFWAFLESLDTQYLEYLLRSSWGQFGWLDFSIQRTWLMRLRSVEPMIGVGTVTAIAVYTLRPLDRSHWLNLPRWMFTIGTFAVGVLFVLFVEHRFRLIGAVGVIQGRNFLIVLPALAIWVTGALGSVVPRSMRTLTAAAIFIGALALNFASLMTILRQHYV